MQQKFEKKDNNPHIESMTDVKHIRDSRKDGIYHNEYPRDEGGRKTISEWQVHVHIALDDLQKAYDIISPIAADRNLSIRFLEGGEEYLEDNATIIIKHTAVEDFEGSLQEIEDALSKERIKRGDLERFKGEELPGSYYAEWGMSHHRKDKFQDPSKSEKENRYKEARPPMPEVNIIRQDELDFSWDEESERGL